VAAAQDKSLKGFGELLASATCVLDALLGTGRLRPLGGVFREVLGRVAEAKKERDLCIIAVDLPSGLDADTGAVDPACLAVDMTVTLAFPKVGLFSFPGAARVGELKIADIGIPEHLAASVKTELITADLARASLPGRPPDANKGSFGRVLVAAGSVSYIGAAYLACSGALRVGAGLVTLATASSLQPIIAAKLAEATYLPLPEDGSGIIAAGAAKTLSEALGRYDVLLLGCGLGQHPSTAGFVRALLSAEAKPAVLDADALNILSQVPAWWQLFGEAIITPHPGEMARLCGLKLAEVQADRLGVARNFAAKWHKVIVLKGAYSVIAAPDGQVAVSPFANPGLASGGTGDVLAGAIAGLVAQGRPLFEAASLGVYLHGVAGEMVKESLGEAGMLASDLLPVLPVVIKRLKE
jgi:NAD(P)H-hydrate epimerase